MKLIIICLIIVSNFSRVLKRRRSSDEKGSMDEEDKMNLKKIQVIF